MEGLETWSPSWRLFYLTISYAVMVGIELVMVGGAPDFESLAQWLEEPLPRASFLGSV